MIPHRRPRTIRYAMRAPPPIPTRYRVAWTTAALVASILFAGALFAWIIL